ncbi:MAG: hypothetical protein IT437_01290 [Phycisphaerales bacterium]|nr:hypothetical protein [Phycisphaerales bacterium]
MTWLAPTVLFGWIPVIIVMFMVLPARRAVLVAYFGAWLFLPNLEYPVRGFPNISKVSVTTYAVLLGVAMVDAGRLTRLRLRWWDAPLLAWCLVPLPSAILNGFGPYDGAAGVVSNLILWGLPYLVGRLYFNTTESVRDLLVAFVVGGLIYLPFIVYEAKMSPTLHFDIYGFRPEQDFATARRMGGWRPMVFMQHGLAVSLFMTIAWIASLGLWLWAGTRTVMMLPTIACCAVLFAGSLLCRSAYAMALMFVAGGLLLVARYKPSRRVVLVLGAIPIAYMTLRTVGGWDASALVNLSTRVFGADRTSSLTYRLESESNLWGLARQKPIFGYGRWVWEGRAPNGGIMVPDGLWIIALGRNGMVGLAAVTLMLVLPAWLALRRLRDPDTTTPGGGLWITVTTIPAIYAMDNLLNAMVNPLFMLAAGGIAGGVSILNHRPPIQHANTTGALPRNTEWNSAPF